MSLDGPWLLDHTEYNNLEVWKARGPEFYVLASDTEAISFFVCPASHIYVRYPMAKEKRPTEMLRLEEVAILAYFVLVGHGLLQHGECDWRSSQSLRYHDYFTLLRSIMKEFVAFAYGSSAVVVKKLGICSGKLQRNRMEVELVEPTRTTGLITERAKMKVLLRETMNLLKVFISQLLLLGHHRPCS